MSRPRIAAITLAALALVAIVTALELKFLGTGLPLLGRLGVFVFINLSVLSLILLVFLVGRTLIRLYFERKRGVAGHRFQTKLVTIFVLLVSIPGIVLFILTSRIVTGTVERLFTIQSQIPLESSVEIAAEIYEKEKELVLSLAIKLAAQKKERIERNQPENMTVTVVKVKNAEFAEGSELIRNAFGGKGDTEIIAEKEEEIVRAAAPAFRGDAVSHVVVVESRLSSALVKNMQVVRTAFEEYKSLESIKTPLKTVYFLALALVTMFVIFIVLWTALNVAKGITGPIQALAEGTRRVAEGHFDTEVTVTSTDEIGTLTQAFNRMVSELKSGRQRLKSAYADVDSKRLILEGIMSNIATGVICLDNAGGVLMINDAACSILGIPQGNMANLTSRDILEQVESEELREILRNLREREFSGKSWQLKATIKGTPAILRLFLANLKDTEGNPTGVLVVFDDLTEVVKAQRAYAWQEVARRMTHEIKNPLTPIKLSAERLLKKHREGASDLDSVLESSLITITNEVEALRCMVNEFSRFGKMPDLKIGVVHIREVIDEVSNLYHGYKDLSVATLVEDNIPPVQIDREQIKRALINLLDNAVEAVDRSGNIWLNAQYNHEDKTLRLIVADDGSGIRPEDRDRLFLPHFSTKKSGTGLGLAIVNKIVSDHRGAIRVEDNTPVGTRFVLELPALQNV